MVLVMNPREHVGGTLRLLGFLNHALDRIQTATNIAKVKGCDRNVAQRTETL